MEDFKQFNETEFELKPYGNDCTEAVKKLNELIKQLNNCYKNESQNFVKTCYIVFQIKQLFGNYDNLYYGRLVDKKHDFYWFDDIMKGFGIDSTQSCRLLKVYDKFIEKVEKENCDVAIKIKDLFFPFSKSKLFELLVVETTQLELDIKNKVLKANMSVKEIREYVKKVTGKIINVHDNVEINEDDIPFAFDINKKYELEYFQQLNKNQLINICWEYQNKIFKGIKLCI